jgi:hypothetical protein
MEKTITKTKIKVEIDNELKDRILTRNLEQEEKQVIIHCKIETLFPTNIRIWPSTFLFPHGSGNKSRLISNFNIPLAPTWEYITDSVTFTLVFSALQSCEMFDMVEVLPYSGWGAFKKMNITRNKTDVYNITLY